MVYVKYLNQGGGDMMEGAESNGNIKIRVQWDKTMLKALIDLIIFIGGPRHGEFSVGKGMASEVEGSGMGLTVQFMLCI